MAEDLVLSLQQSRRLAVRSQCLAGPPPSTVVGRDGLRRLWGLADFPAAEDLPQAAVVTQAAEHALRALGVARARDVERHFTIGWYPGLDLERMGWARPVRVEGGNEQWWVHRDVLPLLDEEWQPRATLLSPFDNLIFGQLLRPGVVRRILSTGESAGRSRRAQAR